MPAPLSPDERRRRGKLDCEIKQLIRAIGMNRLAVAELLLQFHEEGLFRGSHASVEEYARERWKRTRSWVYKMLDVARTARALTSGAGLPAPCSPAQLAPLHGLSVADMRRVWIRAHELLAAEKPGGKLTAGLVRRAKREVVPDAGVEGGGPGAVAERGVPGERQTGPPDGVPAGTPVAEPAVPAEGSADAASRAEEEGSAGTDEGVAPAGDGAAGAAVPVVPRTAMEPWGAWSEEARRALLSLPEPHRYPVARAVLAEAGSATEVTRPLVKEVIRAYKGVLRELGPAGSTVLAGEAQDLVREHGMAPHGGDGASSATILDLFILNPEAADSAVATEGAEVGEGSGDGGVGGDGAPRTKKGTVHLVTPAERRPLLVALPASLCPRALRPSDEKVKVVLVSLAELERRGGPFRDGELDYALIREVGRHEKLPCMINKTTDSVGWAWHTLNTTTGCLHNCDFCYAEEIAARFYIQGFTPTLYPHRLDAFNRAKLPGLTGLTPSQARAARSLFLVSQGDLYGRWMPASYVELNHEEVRRHPGWFVFTLTKHPGRLPEFEYPSNLAVGVTVINQAWVKPAAAALAKVQGAAFTWVSVEPFLGEVDLRPLLEAGVKMVAVGGLSRTRKVAARQPEWSWVEKALLQCREAGASVYWKQNLTVRPQEIPFPDLDASLAAPPLREIRG